MSIRHQQNLSTYKVIVVLLNEMASSITGWLSIHTHSNIVPWHTRMIIAVNMCYKIVLFHTAAVYNNMHIILNLQKAYQGLSSC